MTAPTEAYAARRSPELMAWLRDELRPTPGRGAAVARIAFNCTITVVVAMVFQIPLPAYMAYLVFLVSQKQRVATLITAVARAVAGGHDAPRALALGDRHVSGGAHGAGGPRLRTRSGEARASNGPACARC